MNSDEAIEEELKREGENPNSIFVLGEEDGLICTFTTEGAIQSFFMSDEKAERLKRYLKARNRVFKTMEEARAVLYRINTT